MRILQTGIFFLGVFCLVAALFFIGDDTADVLWRLSVALMLTDLVLMKLWPGVKG